MRFAETPDPLPLRRNEHDVVLVGRTRVTLDTIAQAFGEGMTAEGIVEQYPSLRSADVYAVIAYILNHRSDVAAYLKEQDRRGAAVRREAEAKHPSAGIRERLLSRKRR